MILFIWKNRQGLYEARASRPQSGETWMTSDGLPLEKLILELRKQGCSQQEINDALYNVPTLHAGEPASKNNIFAEPDCLLLLGELGCGCLGAITVLVGTIGTGLYFGIATLMGWA